MFELESNHVDVDCEVYSLREWASTMEIRCDCGEWVEGFAVGGHFGDENGPVTIDCECDRTWAIGAVEVTSESPK